MSLLQLLRFHICAPALRFFTICKYFCSSDILYTFFKVFCLTYYWFHFFFFSLTLSPCLLSSVWCLVSSAKESHSKNKLCPREISRVKFTLDRGTSVLVSHDRRWTRSQMKCYGLHTNRKIIEWYRSLVVHFYGEPKDEKILGRFVLVNDCEKINADQNL